MSTESHATSATLEHVSEPTDAAAAGRAGTASRRFGYGRLWAGVPRELGFLLLGLPVAITGFVVLNAVFWGGIGTAVIYVGLFLLVAALYIARGFGTLELVRLGWAGRGAIVRPAWRPEGRPAGFLRATFGPFVNGHYWLYLLHSYVINPIVGTVTWVVSVVWLASGLGGVTYWFWGRFLPADDQNVWLHSVVLGFFFPGYRTGGDPLAGEAVFLLVVGLLFLATLPFVTRGLTLLHAVIARGVLGAWRSEALQREVADLSASRGAAVLAEDYSLRRLERDIHDGPQQRLVRLQMDLATLERKLDSDPDAARSLAVEARTRAHDTLEELRALSRGFAPPILQDRGLVAALESLAALSTAPVTVEIDLGDASQLPGEVERSVYYLAAELLTNVSKHSGATAARLVARVRPEPTTGGRVLEVWVTDNGAGGARVTGGHGLSGLDERVRGLRGTLVLDSPAGGPTSIGAVIPL
ncbi:sensor domain-containing protein [Microbacterium sp. STN6]|uniref:sensor histidine kinase n=1 Tax=Microbacterium sp. STN6 TaxID=2995588 RepID=UPI002260AFD3|nr:sensor histidine kinase [Microbacterium sp. STN6]MCX7522208.1 sensor domain-containing protein [Microbacterium sp. STN6]